MKRKDGHIKGFLLYVFTLALFWYSTAAFGATIHVPGDQPTIQAAIDAAVNGDVVVVYDGTYLENINFLGKAITVHSENGPEATIIDGGNNDIVVSFFSAEETDSILQGFTIRHASNSGVACSASYPTISDCIIKNNVGNGISLDDSSATISGCVIENNHGGLTGGGIYCWQSAPTITNCTISNNSVDEFLGGGIFMMNSSSPTITGCLIANNAAGASYGQGGGIYIGVNSNPTITNCIISNNSAAEGGGIYCDYSNPEFVNCTISANTATNYGGGIYSIDPGTDNGPIVINTILWGDTAGGIPNEIYLYFDASIDVTYSNIQGGLTGTGNISSDPLFVDPAYRDFHLQSSSPCIDAGNNDAPHLPVLDFEGDARSVDDPNTPDTGNGIPPIVDVGADEFNPAILRANFSASPTTGTQPLTVQFTDHSTGTINLWEWDFDNDGTVDSTDQNPSWIYPDIGNFSVSLKVTGPGEEDTIVKENYIQCLPENVEKWARTYGGSDYDTIKSVKQTADGGYVAAGYTKSFGVGHADLWILKLNADGTIAWQKTYGGSSVDWGVSIQQTTEGGYVCAGATMSFGAGSWDFWVLKLDSNGAISWQKTYGGSNYDMPSTIQQTVDGGYIMVGRTDSYGSMENGDIWVLKLQADGTVDWQKTYGGNYQDFDGTSVHQTKDGGYVVAGTCNYTESNYDFWLLKLDANGVVVWQKTYGGSSTDMATFIQQTADGGFVVAGDTYSFGASSWNFWVLKLDSNGNVVWENAYGGDSADYAYVVRETSDGNYIVAGNTYSFGAGNGDLLLIKLDSDGDIVWQNTYGGTDLEHEMSIEQTTDTGFIVAGSTKSYNAGYYDAWVLKLDMNGEIPGCDILTEGYAQIHYTYAAVANTSVIHLNSPAVPMNTSVIPQDSLSQTVNTCAEPVADFTADMTNGVAPLTVQFTDQSVGSIEIWEWDFDNNGTVDSYDESPAPWTYSEAGDYTVTLTVTGPGGQDTEVKESHIHVSGSICECNLIPDNTIVARGDTLGFQASITNNAGGMGTVLFGTKVTKPDASQTGFIWGPLQVYLNPHQTKSGHKTHTIPSGFELGTYTYHGYVGRYGNIYDECQFDFEVVP
jgi:parallel beta-helix repeat protein